MTWYAVQDEDWDWNNPDGPAFITAAVSPQHAAELAVHHWRWGDKAKFDGVGLKVARLQMEGYIEWDKSVGFSDFNPMNDPPSTFFTKVKGQAEAELAEERFNEAVEREKVRLRTHRLWWERLFPWRIRIERRKT